MQIHAPSTLPPFFRVQKAIYRALPCINYYQLRINKRPISKKFYLVHGLTDNHNDADISWDPLLRKKEHVCTRLNAITLSTYKGRNLSIVLARQDGEKTFATMATLPLTIGKIVSPSMAVITLER